jgi:hypothetical protein
MSKTLKEREAVLKELRDKHKIETLNVDTGEFTVTK